MKSLSKSYLKTVLILFAIFYIFYLLFEFAILDSQIKVWQSILKVMLLAMLLPLFSKKYLAKLANNQDLKKFEKNRTKVYMIIGSLIFLGILFSLFILLFIVKP